MSHFLIQLFSAVCLHFQLILYFSVVKWDFLERISNTVTHCSSNDFCSLRSCWNNITILLFFSKVVVMQSLSSKEVRMGRDGIFWTYRKVTIEKYLCQNLFSWKGTRYIQVLLEVLTKKEGNITKYILHTVPIPSFWLRKYKQIKILAMSWFQLVFCPSKLTELKAKMRLVKQFLFLKNKLNLAGFLAKKKKKTSGF